MQSAARKYRFNDNMWDQSQLAQLKDVATETDVWDWLRNVWAPAIFPKTGHNYIGHDCIGHNHMGHDYTGHNSLRHN